MPLLTIHTNVSASKVSPQLLVDLTDVVAKMLGKPKSYVSVHVIPDQMMVFGGTTDPCAQISLLSIGGLGGEANKRLSNILAKELETKLGVSSERAFIYFNNVTGDQIGYGGSTFA